MKLTPEQYREILKKPAIAANNPVLVGLPDSKREQAAKPALVPCICRSQESQDRMVVVTIISFRKRLLDDDNLVAGGKHLRDRIADSLGCDDADPRITWEYGQCKTDGQQGTIVKIEITYA